MTHVVTISYRLQLYNPRPQLCPQMQTPCRNYIHQNLNITSAQTLSQHKHVNAQSGWQPRAGPGRSPPDLGGEMTRRDPGLPRFPQMKRVASEAPERRSTKREQ